MFSVDDVVNVVVEENPIGESHSATGLTLLSGQTYRSQVRGYNELGFGVSLVSDGMVLDIDGPIAGVVYNGGRMFHIYEQASTSNASAHWFGFDDHDTYIKYYEWAIGVEGDPESIQSFTDTNIQTSVTSTDLTLELGVHYYHTVRAYDAAGFVVESVSEPFFVDDTPPIAVQCPGDDFSVEILTDLEFEGLAGDDGTWNTSEAFLTVDNETAGVVHMRGEVTQQIVLTQHQIYKFVMHTAAPCSSNNSRIKIDYAEVLLDLVPTLYGDCEFHYSFVSQRHSNVSVFSIYSLVGLNLLDISLTECATESEESETPIKIIMIGATDAEIQWFIDDKESRVKYYELTLGTTPGGAQLLLPQNHGLQNTYYAYNLHVAHNVSVYATVVATNLAGLMTRYVISFIII